jgi:hypothetical protein
MRKSSLLVVALAGLVALPAFAQTPPATPPAAQPAPPASPPVRIRGTIDKLDGNALMIKSRDGVSVSVTLADNVQVAYLVKKTMADIKSGDYLASTGIKGADGKIHAIEVRIFPEALRGAGEGQYPWDLKPDTVMTNATAGTITKEGAGNIVSVTYKGNTSDYTIDADTPIFTYAQGDKTLLVPGAAVFIVAPKKDDGSITAARVTVEKDGVKPPM